MKNFSDYNIFTTELIYPYRWPRKLWLLCAFYGAIYFVFVWSMLFSEEPISFYNYMLLFFGGILVLVTIFMLFVDLVKQPRLIIAKDSFTLIGPFNSHTIVYKEIRAIETKFDKYPILAYVAVGRRVKRFVRLLYFFRSKKLQTITLITNSGGILDIYDFYLPSHALPSILLIIKYRRSHKPKSIKKNNFDPLEI